MNDISTMDIVVSLKYCTSKDGLFCNLCKYQRFGSRCSKQLLVDASNRLNEFCKLCESEEKEQ